MLPGLGKVNIRIADITFSLVGLTNGWIWADRDRFETSLSGGRPDTVVRVHTGYPCRPMIRGDLVRSVEGLRNIYLDEQTWTFEFCPYDREIYPQRPPHQVLVFDRRFAAGDLYLSIDTDSDQPTFAFRLFLSELLTAMLPFHDGMMVHASAISDDGTGIVFAGPSGAGKSTMARLWDEHAGVRVLNDDRIILRRNGRRWWAYPVLGVGEPRQGSPDGVALEVVFLLSQADENAAKPMNQGQAASSLIPHISLPSYDAVAVDSVLQLLDELVNEIPTYGLGFLPDQGVVHFVRDTMGQSQDLCRV